MNKKDNKGISIPYKEKLRSARFLERPNRFLIRCLLEKKDSNNVVEAHLPDPGRLKELLIPDRRIWLRPASNPDRKTRWTAVICETPDKEGLVSIDSRLPNRVVARALKEQMLDEFSGWRFDRSEFSMGKSRFDFLLKNNTGQKMALEVKSVTLVKGKVGFFPDAVTSRGRRHIRELTELTPKAGWEAAVLFVVQRSDAEFVRPYKRRDPEFAEALTVASEAGVQLYARKCQIKLEKVILKEGIPVKL